MLFNDEVHTYEQVIYTLQKAVNCTQKEAIGFATTVDRDVSNFIILCYIVCFIILCYIINRILLENRIRGTYVWAVIFNFI